MKDASAPNGWRVEESGRRPSKLLLFEYWFEEDHEVASFPVPFRYHFCQREAIKTLVYLVGVVQNRDAKPLIQQYAMR